MDYVLLFFCTDGKRAFYLRAPVARAAENVLALKNVMLVTAVS